MRVRWLVGPRAGEVVDLPVPSARAMLADGRAVAPDADERLPMPVDPVSTRQDRVAPGAKRRQRR